MKRSSSIEKLKLVPECFTDKVFMRLTGSTIESARVALSRMKSAGLIASAGNRSGVYYNLLKNHNADNEFSVDALLHLYPTAVLTGESVLHNAGWITQIPSAISVAVLKKGSYQKVTGFSISGKPSSWFKRNHAVFLEANNSEFATHGLRALPPALALVDLLANGEAGLDPDDIDIPDEDMSAVQLFSEQENFDLAAFLSGESSSLKYR